jgi:hypothetical protein
VPIRVKALLEELEPTEEEHQRVLEPARTQIARQERIEYDALEEAIPDLNGPHTTVEHIIGIWLSVRRFPQSYR